jgi:hypothetical protein
MSTSGGGQQGSARATEISKADFEASIERKIDFQIPYDFKAATHAAKLGQTFAEANRATKAGAALRDVAQAVRAWALPAMKRWPPAAAEEKSLLGKFDLKASCPKRPSPLPDPRTEGSRWIRSDRADRPCAAGPAGDRGAGLAGPNAAKERSRRLQSVRFAIPTAPTRAREAQMRRAVAQRKPPCRASRARPAAARRWPCGCTARARLDGPEYMYACGGIMAVVALLVLLKSGSLLVWAWRWAFWWARACRIWWWAA